MIRLFCIFGLMCVSCCIAEAQETFVLWDKTNDIPVSHASVYTTRNGEINATYSGEDGVTHVNFKYDDLVISHINYKRETVRRFQDTIYLEPMIQILPSVVVKPVEPVWIRLFLKNFIKSKKSLYSIQDTLQYTYISRNLGNSSLYEFESSGCLTKDKMYFVNPIKNTITYKDKTAGCDFTALKNILYHDFVSDINDEFIKYHKFYVDDEHGFPDNHIVRILFKSTIYEKDSGYIQIDTLNNVILKAKRVTGLDCNIKCRTNPFVRSIFSLFAGHKYEEWDIDYEVDYYRQGNTYYISDCRYNTIMLEKFSSKGFRDVTFYHITSTYSAIPLSGHIIDNKAFLVLPEPFEMKLVLTKKERKLEEYLQKVDKSYRIY